MDSSTSDAQVAPPADSPTKIPNELPDVSAIAALDDAFVAGILDLLFEPSPGLHALALPIVRSATFSSYAGLVDAVREALLSLQASSLAESSSSSRAQLHRILGSHPRLGEKKVESAQSRAEQANLQKCTAGGGDGAAEAQRLAALNAEYEARFPGLRYVVFVNGRGRTEIMENMRARIDRGDVEAEEREAIQAMSDIAKDRAKKLLRVSTTAT